MLAGAYKLETRARDPSPGRFAPSDLIPAELFATSGTRYKLVTALSNAVIGPTPRILEILGLMGPERCM